LVYVKVENLIPGSSSRTIDGKLAVQDGSPLVYTGATHRIKKAIYKFKWDRLFGTSAGSFLTPGMAAHIHDMAGYKVDNELREICWIRLRGPCLFSKGPLSGEIIIINVTPALVCACKMGISLDQNAVERILYSGT
jgi:hypothetical protein